ncbi:MAG: YqaE/Pmp3 family membrane protein [Halomonas sp.]|nr:YqaE/Pmp3 family membrane protein [Halomonas sp.]MBP5980398.1 YqaE/Pmp3 family membrane protein [Halomonas sp.]
MDAREYLNRKGVGVEREPDRPNTLEEKSWERARGAGQQRPKSGTPHDWEDWERYHDDLTQGAIELEQKINKQAHRKEAREQVGTQPAQPVVEHFTPPVSPHQPKPSPSHVKSGNAHLETKTDEVASHKTKPEKPDAASPAPEPKALKAAYMALAVLLPPLALGLTGAGATRILIGVMLTLLGWLPGVIYALLWVKRL